MWVKVHSFSVKMHEKSFGRQLDYAHIHEGSIDMPGLTKESLHCSPDLYMDLMRGGKGQRMK